MKNLFLSGFVIFIIPMTLYAANQDGTTIDETYINIEKICRGLDPECRKQCSLLADVLSMGGCSEKFVTDYQKQLNAYVLRKYVKRCAGKQSNEKWRYKTNPREKSEDMAATDKAIDLLKSDSAIDTCTKECIQQYKAKLQFVLRKLEKARREKKARWTR